MIQTSPPDSGAVPSAPSAVEVRGLTADFAGTVVLSRVSLSIPAGALLAVVGPRGAGKSTLLRCLLGRQPARAGEVRVLGLPPARAREVVGYLPQRELVDWRFPLSAVDAVLMGRYRRVGWLRRPGRADRGVALDCLAQVGLERQAECRVNELSPGQRRRLMLARALASEPELLLMDEPTAGMAARERAALMDLTAAIAEAQGIGVLFTEHDMDVVFGHAARVLVLLRGRIIASGAPDEIRRNPEVRRAYLGDDHVLERPAGAGSQGASPA